MAISVRSVTAMVDGSATTITDGLPSGQAADDQLVHVVVSSGDRTLTADADYTQLANILNSISTIRLLVERKTSVGAGEAAPTVEINTGGSGWSTAMLALIGVDPTTPMDATSVEDTSDAASTWAPTGITTATAGAMVLSIVCSRDDNALGLLSGSEQGFTLLAGGADYDTFAATDRAMGVAYKVVTTAGAVTMPTWEQTSVGPDVWCHLAVAFKPATTAPAYSGSASVSSTSGATVVGVKKVSGTAVPGAVTSGAVAAGKKAAAGTVSVSAASGSVAVGVKKIAWGVTLYENDVATIASGTRGAAGAAVPGAVTSSAAAVGKGARSGAASVSSTSSSVAVGKKAVAGVASVGATAGTAAVGVTVEVALRVTAAELTGEYHLESKFGNALVSHSGSTEAVGRRAATGAPSATAAASATAAGLKKALSGSIPVSVNSSAVATGSALELHTGTASVSSTSGTAATGTKFIPGEDKTGTASVSSGHTPTVTGTSARNGTASTSETGGLAAVGRSARAGTALVSSASSAVVVGVKNAYGAAVPGAVTSSAIAFGVATIVVEVSVAAGADDGKSYDTGTFISNGTNIHVGAGGPSEFYADVWLRFPGVTIPQGAVITDAYLHIVAAAGVGVDGLRSNIYGNAADNATAPTDRATHAAKARTTAFTAFDTPAAWVAGTTYQMPSITAVIQEIVDRAGWASGNALMILWDDDGSTAINHYIGLAAYEHATDAPALLHIEYVNTTGQLQVTAAQLTGSGTAVSAPSLFGAATVTHTSGAVASGRQNNPVEVTHTSSATATGTSTRTGVVALAMFTTATVPPAGRRFRLRKSAGGSALRDDDGIRGGLPQEVGGVAEVTHASSASAVGVKGGGSRLEVTAAELGGIYQIGKVVQVVAYQDAQATGTSSRTGTGTVAMATAAAISAGSERFGIATIASTAGATAGGGGRLGEAGITIVTAAHATGFKQVGVDAAADTRTPLDYKSFLEYRNTR